MISIARSFGAPLTVPAGNIAFKTSIADRSFFSVPCTFETKCITCEKYSTVAYFKTLTEPGSEIRPMSFRAKSTNIACSARSFSSDKRSAANSESSISFLPRRRVPAIGYEKTLSPDTFTNISGDAPTNFTEPKFKKNIYGEGLT